MGGPGTVPQTNVSGFLAVRSFDGSIAQDLITAIVDVAAHRGRPEMWADDGVVLVGFSGFRGSAIEIADDLVVAADARIDNVDELIRSAGISPTSSPAAIIAAMWRRNGSAGIARIIGDLTAAIWVRSERALYVVRDAVGARGSFIARTRSRVLAASELSMVLADPELDRSLDRSFMASYLASLPAFHQVTGYRAVSRQRPGTVLRLDRSATHQKRWHQWRAETIKVADPREYAERFGELFEEATRCRVGGTTGVALSGGLDSTSVAAALASAAPKTDRVALAIGFTDPKGDERELQQMAASATGCRLAWVTLGTGGPFGGDADDVLGRLGAPPLAPNWFQADALYAEAARQGVDVVLDGIDGDGVVGGTPWYLSDLFVTGRWATWLREARALKRVMGIGSRQALVQYTIRPLVPTAAMPLLRKFRGEDRVPRAMSKSFANEMGVARSMDAEPWRPGRMNRTHQYSIAGPGYVPMTLELMDVLGAHHGVEVAHPFLDRRVIEFCMGLPWHRTLSGGYTKVVLRDAMKHLLPTDITERPVKADLSEPFERAIFGPENHRVREGLALAASNGFEWVDVEGIADILRELEAGRADGEIYRVATLARWQEREAQRKETDSSS